MARDNGVTPPLILAPTDAGMRGALDLRCGPDRILEELTLLQVLGEGPAWDVHRLHLSGPDLACSDGLAVAGAWAVANAVAPLVARGQVPLLAGGDHTVAAGSFVGVTRGLRHRYGLDVPLYLLWLDAHPDANTPQTSPSGNFHGMVLAGLLGAGPLALDTPLPPERVVLAGARDFDPGERAFLAARPAVRQWDVAALRDGGWRPLLSTLLQEVERRAGRLYVSLDLDVVDPLEAPGVAVPVPAGANGAEALALLRRVAASGLLAGADVVELSPAADRGGQTAALAAQALLALAGCPVPVTSHAVDVAVQARRPTITPVALV